MAALPPLIAPPMFDPESAIDLPPVEGPPMPADFEIEPGPAIVAPEQPTEIEATPLSAPLAGIAAPAEGPDVDVARGFDTLREVGSVRTQAQQQGALAAQSYRQAAEAYQSATTPKARAAAEKQAAEALQQIEGADAVAGAAQLAEEREQAAQQATVEDAISRTRTAKLAEVAQVLDDRATATEQAVAQARATQAAAQERRAAREAEYAALLDRGPQDQSATWTSAIGMIGELWSAYAQKREPNLGVWLERGLQQARESHQGDLAAAEKRIGTEEGMEEDAAVAIAQRQADDLAFEQAYLSKVQRDLEVVAAQYGQTPQGMAAEQARQRVALEQNAKRKLEVATSEKAQREREKHAAEMRKLDAEASIAERKASGGGGAAGAKFGQRDDVPESALIDPVTGVVLGESRFSTPKDVRADQDKLNEMSGILQDMQDYINLLANTGRVYQGAGAKFVKSSDKAKLESKYSKLLADIIRAYSGAAASEKEVDRLQKVLPAPKSYTDLGSWDPADVVREYRDTHSRVYENFLTSRLTTGGTLIRGAKGETLPTSPTFGWRSEKGDAPIRTTTGDIVVDLNADSDREFEGKLSGWVNRAVGNQDREKVVEGLRSAADALKATNQKERAKTVRDALKQVEKGESRVPTGGSFVDILPVGDDAARPQVWLRFKAGTSMRMDADHWEANKEKLEAQGFSLLEDAE